MIVSRLRVILDGDSRGAERALAATRASARATARTLDTTVITSLKATAAGFAALGVQASAGGIVALSNALVPLVGLTGALPGLLAAAGVTAGTLKLGLFGVADAFGALGDDPEKFAEALEKLAPEAREFMVALRDLSPEFRALRDSVQQSLFQDLAEEVEDLTGAYLPLLNEHLSAIAANLNRGAVEVSNFLTEAEQIRDIDGILGNSRQAVANFTGAFEPLTAALIDLTFVSSTFMPAFGSWLTDISEGLRDATAAGRESGAIAEFIEDGVDAAQQLGRVLGNVGGIIRGVFSAGGGDGLLEGWVVATQGVEDFVKSVEGQDALGKFFESAATAGEVLADVLGPLFVLISEASVVLTTLAEAATPGIVIFLEQMATAVETLVPAADVLGEALGGVFENLAPLLPVLADTLTVFIEAVAPVLDVVSLLVSRLGQELGPALQTVLPALSEGLVAIGDALLWATPGVGMALGSFADGIAQVLPVLGQLIGQLITELLPTFSLLIADVVPLLVPVLLELGEGLGQIIPVVGQLAEELAPVILQLVEELAPVLVEITPDLVDLALAIGEVLLAITPLLPPLADLVGWLAQGAPVISLNIQLVSILVRGLGDLIGILATLVEGNLRIFVGVIKEVGELIGNLAYAVTHDLGAVPDAIGDFAEGLGDLLYDAGGDLVNGLVLGIKDMALAPVNALEDIAGDMKDGFTGFFDIRSPSRVMRELGGYVGEGVELGLDDSFAGVQASMRDLTDLGALASPGFTAGDFAAATAAPATAAGTVINVTNHFDSTIADATRDDIDRMVAESLGDQLGVGASAVTTQRGR